ncbi:hypothetical protein A9Q89_06580 [Gammaproteobacteria bacterium 53_120_T64]|nr:hypothetical protein A9Q89_06580 [Gammaproteobacteria bacterium 53_120_T64]
MRKTLDQDVIAAHEAGHVVLAHYFGREVYGAYLQAQPAAHRGRSERSHVRFALTPHIEGVHLDLARLDERWPLVVRETLVTTRIRLAGPLAQSIYQQQCYRDIAGGQDYSDAIAELLRLERLRLSLPEPKALDTSYKADDILDQLGDGIMRLLTTPVYGLYLQRIARSLLDKEELCGLEITPLLEGMPRHQW